MQPKEGVAKRKMRRDKISSKAGQLKSKRCQSKAVCRKSDSSRANAMDEMKESATMQQRDLAKTLSHVQKQEPIQPESVITKPTQEETINIDLPAITPTIEERASVVKESEQASQGRMDEDEMLA